MVKVKICGITNLDDALYAAKQGADALGFVFYKRSPRYIQPKEAKAIIKQLPKTIKKVGVFVGAREQTIKKIARDLRLDILQFHGRESAQFCRKFKRFKVIKAFCVKDAISRSNLSKYDTWAYLFDTFEKNRFGGTGKTFKWETLGCLTGLSNAIFLSGGLNSRNIAKALKVFSVDWVDASSCLEKYPGNKDHFQVKSFINKAKSV